MPNLLSPPELIIPDVAHGNSAVLLDGRLVTLVDCGFDGEFLVELLISLEVQVVDQVLISHPDIDHIGGLKDLLRKFPVRRLLLNPDPTKMGEKWQDMKRTIEWAATHAGVQVYVGLNTFSPYILSNEVQIEILAPSLSLALSGVGGRYLDGHHVNSNTMSVVVGLVHKGCRVALLPGDMDAFGLDNLLARQSNIEAKVLVFPHHGGSSDSGDDYGFASRLGSLVKPALTIFSQQRGRYDNPRLEVVEGIQATCPDVHIMCTQLSCQCAEQLPTTRPSHLTDLPAKGKWNRACCGGTIRIRLDGEQTGYDPPLHLHRPFVESLPTPLCLRSFASRASG